MIDNKKEKQELQQIKNQVKKESEEKKEIEISLQRSDEEVEKKITPVEKIQELKNKKTKYAYFKLKDIWSFYFEDEINNLWLYFEWEKIWTFNKVNVWKLWIINIIWNTNYIFILVGEEKFLYNLKTKIIKTILLKPKIEYLKKWINNLEFLFKTPVGIFIYTIINDKLEYFVFFEDFVYYNNGYLWIVKSNEDIKLKNLGFEEEKENLIIYYNPNTKQKSIIYKTELNFKKIYYKWDKIYFEDDEWDEYELTNLN